MTIITKIHIAPLFIDALSLLMLVSLMLVVAAIAFGRLKSLKNVVGHKFDLGREHRLSRANYKPRVLGLGAAFLVITLLVLERGWSYWYFFFMVPSFLVYPHLVLLAAKAFPGDKKAELNAMIAEAFMVGLWTAFMHFFLMESYAFLTGIIITSLMTGGLRQMSKALVSFVAGMALGGLATGFKMELEAPLYIELFALATLLFFLVNVAASFYNQARRMAFIRGELEEKNGTLNKTVEELHATKNELVEKAHKAGMADIATGVLHNIGNILNSVNTSASVIEKTVKQSNVKKLEQANSMLREHIDRIEAFIAKDSRGKQLLQYYLKMEEPLKDEQAKLIQQSERLTHKINLINEVIAAQQSYAGTNMDADKITLPEIIEDALTLQAGSVSRHGLEIKKDFQPVDPIIAQRSKLIHVLVNLLKNAKDATVQNPPGNKVVLIKTWQDDDRVFLSVADNGSGIKKEHLNKIFTHGFTTKKDGHGFGLHSSANYMKEMKGGIRVDSEGSGKGTTFTLSFSKNAQELNHLQELETIEYKDR